MTRDKKVLSFAKKLVEMSRDNGVVTEAKVAEVLAALKQAKPRHELQVLKTYLSFPQGRRRTNCRRCHSRRTQRRCTRGHRGQFLESLRPPDQVRSRRRTHL